MRKARHLILLCDCHSGCDHVSRWVYYGHSGGKKDLGKCSDEEKNHILILRKIKSNYEWCSSAGLYLLVMMPSQSNKIQLLLAKHPFLLLTP